MKKLILTLSLLAVGVAPVFAQTWRNPLPVDSATQRVTYTAVVEVPGATKAELYSRAREWFATTFGSSKAVLEMDDREVGKLVGRGNDEFSWGMGVGSAPYRLWRTIKVEVKDNKYRYTFTNFDMAGAAEPEGAAKPIERWFKPSWATFNKDGSPKRVVSSVLDATQQSGQTEATSLRRAMAQKAGGDF